MSEDLILHVIPARIKELGFTKYELRYKDLVIPSLTTLRIESSSELHYISGDPLGVVIESDYGIYDGTGTNLCDNEHVHRGDIYLSNPGNIPQRIKLVQVIPDL
jgi:hypothetical protein